MDHNVEIRNLALELSDLEVALFLCLAVHEHCRVETTDTNINDVAKELALICSITFGLTRVLVDCSSATTVDTFLTAISAPQPPKDHARPTRSRMPTESSSTSLSTHDLQTGKGRARSSKLPGQTSTIPNVIIAKNFNHVDDEIQRTLLELMRSKKLSLQAGTWEAPADFLFVPLIARTGGRDQPLLNPHLNDHLFISHYQDPEDSFVYLEEDNDWLSEGQASASSVIRKSDTKPSQSHPNIDRKVLDHVQQASDAVIVGADIIRYQQDIVVFLRLSRAVAGGISTRSNLHFKAFSRLLAVLHGLDFVTPSIVALAAKKVFRHRIVVARPEDDRSLQYGSDLAAVSKVLEYADPDTILEGVLTLEAPL
ncbi:uncharacterized protein BP01DRAFT_352115 [Aspergillus saccharolyticus JOP 1030-1]|uniref:magnesium chelatase n=1 Tax=Aspergillus saccharolyticus JOP 1030-1 TaxID=1450539 RepID=A0A318ZS89_9EURO|nr:hypothetical protein BP01DRAFT_352115 [Aspergillus saccharolyticus JOP 1030-1]PYH49545.1 hypothetical protein BP01DRAFT_352115 [Aspergillus saccharolyticus JOP 1030-1]